MKYMGKLFLALEVICNRLYVFKELYCILFLRNHLAIRISLHSHPHHATVLDPYKPVELCPVAFIEVFPLDILINFFLPDTFVDV